MATHEVLNQPPPLVDYDVFASDAALVEGLRREGAGWAEDELSELGRLAGTAEAIEWGFQANANPPVLRTHDRYGNRVDVVEYHPAYHSLMRVAVGQGMHAAPWSAGSGPDGAAGSGGGGAASGGGAHVARAAKFYVWSQVEPGHGCPISMTYAVVPALRANPQAAAEWEPLLFSREYDGRNLPASEKRGAIAGMAMTEKQGGSDVRANTTRAVRVGAGDGGGAGDGAWELTGHKWFCSAPMSDVFLMLAQTDAGLSCFAVPRWRPDGTKNPIFIQRLKDKLGNRSNASSEIELDGAYGVLVGEEGRGVRTIIAMVNHTRLDCVIGASATMRQAFVQAAWHASHRSAFGRVLVEQPLMANVLADLAVESEAATAVMMRLARAYDAGESTFARLATAVGKYWVCKRQPTFVGEALECLGGNGYVEESIMPRLFRESPLNGIWEGSGNVICLDVLRAMAREPESVVAFREELSLALGADARYDAFVARLDAELGDLDGIESRARRIVERMALALQGSLLVRFSDAAVADAFCASRLSEDWGVALGTLDTRRLRADAIIDRARPKP